MPDTPNTPAPKTEEPHGTEEQTPQETPSEPKVDTTDWKAEARKWEERAKAYKPAADQLKAIEDEKKTDAERAAEALKAAEERAAEAESRAERMSIVAEFRLSKEDAEVLEGVTDPVALRAIAGRLASAAEKRESNPLPGGYVPNEGHTPTSPSNDDATARSIFGL